jgi:hypothetical protein
VRIADKFKDNRLSRILQIELNLMPHNVIYGVRAMNAKPSFRPVPCNGGWQILVTWPNARTEQLGGYSSEAEAVKWINNVSDKWTDKALAGKKYRHRTFNAKAIVQLFAVRLTAGIARCLDRVRA